MLITAATLLIRTVYAILPLDTMRESMYSPFVGDDSVHIKPDGPLNFTYGHTCHKDSLANKMRLFSPALKINYMLTMSEDGDCKFEINNNKDGINTFKGNDNAANYLTSYYKVFKEMFNVVNNEVNIHTARKSSLFTFLTERLNSTSRFKLLAAMIMLAEGVDVPLKFENRQVTLNGSEINAPVLVYGNKSHFLVIEMYEIIGRPGFQNPDGLFTEGKDVLHKFKEIRNLLDFFINFGGSGNEKLNFLDLSFNETPKFLILYYVYEFIEDLNDARKLFSAVKELLECTGNHEKDREPWNLFFTNDIKELDKCEPYYEIYQTIDGLMLEIPFPFSAYNQPPSSVVVKGYNRKTGEEVDSFDLKFSDCCGITIYSLLCCLFYDPSDKRYKLDHLRSKNYTPSKDLSSFFGSICKKPEGSATQALHQQWTHVVQDLLLSEGELKGEEASGSNTIVYRKEKNGVHAEIKTELLNILKIIAKITGMPRKRMIELNKIRLMAKDVNVSWNVLRQSIEAFTTQVIQDISIIPVKISFEDLKTNDTTAFKGIYGTVNLKFSPKNDDGLLGLSRTIQFSFKDGHSKALVSNTCMIDSEISLTLTKLLLKCDDMEKTLIRRLEIYVNRFLEGGKFEPVSSEVVKKIEDASNEIERYTEINKIQMDYRIETMDEKLYFIDLFGPYLDRMTARDEEVVKNTYVLHYENRNVSLVQNPQDSASLQKLLNAETIISDQLEARDPIIQFIANMMGSVSLGDKVTQELFIQIFGFCNDRYGELFPRICGDFCFILPKFADFEKAGKTDNNSMIIWRLTDQTMPNTMLRLWNTLRSLHGEFFFEKLKYENALSGLYIMTIVRSIIANNFVGIETARKDLRIQGSMIGAGPDSFFRAAAWFSISMRAEYREGIEIVCNSWDELCGEDSFIAALFQTRSTNLFLWKAQFKGGFLDSLYENKLYERKLIEIYCYFSYRSAQFDEACILLKSSHHPGDLFEVLCNSLEKVIENGLNYLSKILIEYPVIYDIFGLTMEYINEIDRFVRQVNTLRKEVAQDLKNRGESDPRLDRSLDNISEGLDKIRNLFENIFA